MSTVLLCMAESDYNETDGDAVGLLAVEPESSSDTTIALPEVNPIMPLSYRYERGLPGSFPGVLLAHCLAAYF